jgi:hypothetical protein
MKKFLLLIALFAFGGQAFALSSPTGEETGSYGFDQESRNLHHESYTCWARTACPGGNEISCSATGDRGCTWEYRPYDFVRCEGFNWDGSMSRSVVYCN